MQPNEKNQKRPTHPLFDYLTENFDLKNDLQIALELHRTPSSISKFRSRKRPITPALIIAVHERFDIPIKTIKELL
jgi:plasmid maintenance system antidote protein VapI